MHKIKKTSDSITQKAFYNIKKQKIISFAKKTFHSNTEFRDTKKSYTVGNTGIILREVSIGEQLNSIAIKFPNNDALYIHHQKLRVSYLELNEKVSTTAKAFISLGVTTKSKIAIYAPNCLEWVLAQYACARLGIPLANINPAYQINDLKYSLNVLGINILIMSRKLKTTNYLEIINNLNPDLKGKHQSPTSLNLKALPDLKQIILLDDLAAGESESANYSELKKISNENNIIFWDELIDSAKNTSNKIQDIYRKMKNNVNIHDPVNIQFTSGTTGLPKGAVLSHYNILNNGYLIGKNLNYDEKDRVMIPVPLYHCFGSVMGNLACLNFGSTIVYPNSTFDAIKTLDIIEQEKCTSLYGVPTMFVEVLNQQQIYKRNIEKLRTGIMAGAVCPKYLMDRCINELNLNNLTICYGMTELSPVTHQTSIYDNINKKTTTVGQILPHTITKIVDNEGNIVPKGTIGEICTKSYGLFMGYFANDNATKETIDNYGFMKTGDLGFIDEEGYLHIEGRKKDVIIRGGENISPKEIEDYIGTHHMVDDVQVIGVRDLKFGDEICAWIKLRKEFSGKIDKKGILEYCKKKIAHYKIPRYVKFVEGFPMTVTGKPLKMKMREITNKIIEEKSEEL